MSDANSTESSQVTNFTNAPDLSYEPISTFSRGMLAILLRTGYILLQIGSIPVSDVSLILFQNIIDFTVATISYTLLGSIIAFGTDANHFMGYYYAGHEKNIDDLVLGWATVVTTTAIFSTVLAGRMHIVGYVLVSFVVSTIVQPFPLHWIWTEQGFMHRGIFENHGISYKDLGGGSVIHLLAGTVALLGAMFLGRRLIRVKDIHEYSLPSSGPVFIVLGYLLIMLGFIGISLPTSHYIRGHPNHKTLVIILVNNVLAAAGATLITGIRLCVGLTQRRLNVWMISSCFESAIAGMVFISAGADVYNPYMALTCGIFAGFIWCSAAKLLATSPLEDCCTIIPTHLFCGLIGTLAPAFLASQKHLGSAAPHLVFLQFGWQSACTITLLCWYSFIMLFVFGLLAVTGFLRNRYDNVDHLRAMAVHKRGQRRRMGERLFRLLPFDRKRLMPGYVGKSAEGVPFGMNNKEIVSAEPDVRYAARQTTRVNVALCETRFQPDEATESREISKILRHGQTNDRGDVLETGSDLHSRIEDCKTKRDRGIYTTPRGDSPRGDDEQRPVDPRLRADFGDGVVDKNESPIITQENQVLNERIHTWFNRC